MSASEYRSTALTSEGPLARVDAAGSTPGVESPPGASRTTPRVWVLLGHRAGDNAQLLALADALDCPYEVKRFVHRRLELVTNLLFDATLLGRIAPRSSALGPP